MLLVHRNFSLNYNGQQNAPQPRTASAALWEAVAPASNWVAWPTPASASSTCSSEYMPTWPPAPIAEMMTPAVHRIAYPTESSP